MSNVCTVFSLIQRVSPEKGKKREKFVKNLVANERNLENAKLISDFPRKSNICLFKKRLVRNSEMMSKKN